NRPPFAVNLRIASPSAPCLSWSRSVDLIEDPRQGRYQRSQPGAEKSQGDAAQASGVIVPASVSPAPTRCDDCVVSATVTVVTTRRGRRERERLHSGSESRFLPSRAR